MDIDDAFIVAKDTTGQTISEELQKNNRPFPGLASATVEFSMRELYSSVLKVDHETATVENTATALVSYEWATGDTDTSGQYAGWWTITISGITVDSPEFLIIVDEHAPGIRTKTGLVYLLAKSEIPSTWVALEQWQDYGDALLQQRIEVEKLRTFGAAVAVDDEADYDIRVISYIAKCTALSVIPAGMDYWMNQKLSVSATGTNEAITYESRIDALTEIQKRLIAETAVLKDEIEDILDVGTTAPNNAVPGTTDGTDENFITPLPAQNFIDYAFPFNTSRTRRRATKDDSWSDF